MIRGIYSAAAGMVVNFRRQAIIANNVANALTTGYKQDVVELGSADEIVLGGSVSRERMAPEQAAFGSVGLGSQIRAVGPDMTQGDLMETGNPLDIAIVGSGFLAVQTPGGIYYTRDGALSRDARGYLVRSDGGLVLGENGPIQVGQGYVLVEGDGLVTSDGLEVGRILLYDLAGPLERMGNSYFSAPNPGLPPSLSQESQLSQGFLERSNVNIAQAMVDTMAVSRLYEASQRILMLQDQTLAKAVNDVGKV